MRERIDQNVQLAGRFHYFRSLQKNCTSKTNLMRIARLLLLSTIAILFAGFANAQNINTAKADEEFNNGGYLEAARLYKSAASNEKDLEQKARIFFNLGECYRLATQYAASIEWYDKAITAQYYNTDPEVYFNLGQAYQEMEKWDDAATQYNKYSAKGGDKAKADARIKACKEAANVKTAKTRILVENMAELNSPAFDYSLNYSSKKFDEMIFSSSRQSAVGSGIDPRSGEDFMDLFFSERDKKGKWSVPQPLPNTVNTQSNEGAAAFTKDYNVIYFTFCEITADERKACDIVSAKRQGNGYAAPVSLGLVNRESMDTVMVGHPAFSNDEKYLVFASDMPGGKGGKDLWYSTFDKKSDKWSTPTNLGAINTTGDEMFPYLADDGTLYFSSNGHPGLGGLDIFKADKTGDLSFGTVSHIDYPINSSSDDFGFIFEKGGAPEVKYSGFFTSNRPGGKGKDDIYRFMEPPMEFSLTGVAYDQDTGTPLANANVVVKGSDGSDYALTTDGNGGFSLDKTKIKAEVTYSVDVQKEKYIGTGDRFNTIKLKESTNFTREYFLKPVIINIEYKMPLVLYPYNETILLINDTVNSADSLNYLYDLMVKNPKFVIQLEAHTDARGADDYNQKLSQGRAETCVSYLVSKGIDANRLKPAGKGEKEPRKLTAAEGPIPAGTVLTEAYINKLPADQQELAHQLNRRTIFRITATDYVPKK